jgi:hypothetical protein
MAEPWQFKLELYREGYVLLGCGERDRARGTRGPRYLTLEFLDKNHRSNWGVSGTGKTMIEALLLAQCLQFGRAVIVFDPKHDGNLPGILADAAKRNGLPIVFINLNENVPQINPFADTTFEEREQLLQSALGLDPTGEASDFYRAEDRDACSELLETGADDLQQMVLNGSDMKTVTSRQNFWRGLKQLARLQAFHTADSPDLVGTLEAGGLIYVVGSAHDLRVKAAQKMLLTRVNQIITNRPRGSRQVHLFMDEFKHLISPTANTSLGVIRDRNCTLSIASQSYSDLADCGALRQML